MSSASESIGTKVALSGLVPMVRVADVERSIEFYRQLGFEVGNSVPPQGQKHWAWLYCPEVADWRRGANLMLTRGHDALSAKGHSVLLYLYVADLVTLRESLIEKGMKVGQISYPDYLPKGEFEIEDPDGYCLMVAQSGPDTP
jgi:catechol 2,3-dioxygenase-like lactoylglutathione lyase family enzyme